jgi:hypothetical protein
MGVFSEQFLSGRTPPKGLPLHSRALQDWYDEQLYYCFEGRTINGLTLTGDHLWFLNFTPIELFYTNPLTNNPNDLIQEWGCPRYSQEDDYIFKQIHEAEQEQMGTILFTARGYGKTFLVVSIGLKVYYLEVGSHSLITAAIDDHARPTFEKTKKVMNKLEENHPILSLKRIKDNDDIIQAGELRKIEGVDKPLITSQFEKIVYGNSAGKSKGRRVRFQQWEEMGDWSCSAKLTDCIASSMGTWELSNARVFYTGTGGTVKSDQAAEIFFNPGAFNIYAVKPYEQRRIMHLVPEYGESDRPEGSEQGIFLPALVKRKDFYEFDRFDEKGNLQFIAGESDMEGALQEIQAKRKAMESQPAFLSKVIQEYPLTPAECFSQGGAGVFDRARLGIQKLRLTTGQIQLPEWIQGESEKPTKPRRGKLEWVKHRETNKVIGVEFIEDESGHFLVAEPPPMDKQGRVIPMENAYIGGLDSIDQGLEDSTSMLGSKLALAIKKRQQGVGTLSNFFCCIYLNRPDDVDDAYDDVLKCLWWYGCRVNLEYTRIGIKNYFRSKGQFWRLVERPKIAIDSTDPDQQQSLVGTQMTEKMLAYGISRIKAHLRENMHMMFFREAIQQFYDYTLGQKTKFDLVPAFMLAEIADEDMMEMIPTKVREPEHIELPCFYEDEFGNMQYGVRPTDLPEHREMFGTFAPPPAVSHYDEKGREVMQRRHTVADGHDDYEFNVTYMSDDTRRLLEALETNY